MWAKDRRTRFVLLSEFLNCLPVPPVPGSSFKSLHSSQVNIQGFQHTLIDRASLENIRICGFIEERLRQSHVQFFFA